MSSKIAIEPGEKHESEVLGNDDINGIKWNDQQSSKDCQSEIEDTYYPQQSENENQDTDEGVQDIKKLRSDASWYGQMPAFFARVCRNQWFQICFLCVSVVHNVYMVIREETRYLGEASFALDILFALLYLAQTLMMVTSCCLRAFSIDWIL